MSNCLKKIVLCTSGYALPSVLMITLLVVTLIMGLLTVIFFYDGISMRMIEREKLDIAGYSALQMLMSDTTGISAGNSLYNIDSISVTTVTRLKGFYWEVTTIANGKNDSSRVNYLLGSPVENSRLFTNAVILSRPNLRATVAGNTKITGNILATTKRIIKGNIFGEPPVDEDYLDGEMVSKLSEGFKNANKHIDWNRIKDFRNLVAHDYFGIDAEEVWQIIKKDLPNLEKDILGIIKA
jgi:Ribonuclease HepT-like